MLKAKVLHFYLKSIRLVDQLLGNGSKGTSSMGKLKISLEVVDLRHFQGSRLGTVEKS